MTQRPVWLRQERAYRAYVRGLRYTLLAGLLIILFGLLRTSGVLPRPAGDGLVIACFAVAFVSVLTGMIGWVLVPDKHRAILHQGAFLAMVGRDVVKGLPRDEPA
jgi:hypothetical protein